MTCTRSGLGGVWFPEVKHKKVASTDGLHLHILHIAGQQIHRGLVAQEVLRALQKDYRSFFARLKQQRGNGDDVTARLPWFKSTRYFFTLTYIQSGFALKDGKLVLSGGMEEYTDKKGRRKRRRRKKIHSLTVTPRDGR